MPRIAAERKRPAQPMRIHLYAACWNERRMLDFFFRHYDPIVDRCFIYDDGSTDGSVERLQQHPSVTLAAARAHRPDVYRRVPAASL